MLSSSKSCRKLVFTSWWSNIFDRSYKIIDEWWECFECYCTCGYDELFIFYNDFLMIYYAFLLLPWNNNSVRGYYVVVNACCLWSVWSLNVVVVVELHLLVWHASYVIYVVKEMSSHVQCRILWLVPSLVRG